VLIAALVAACHDPDKYLPEGPTNTGGTPIDSILNLAADPATIKANGGSRARILATIDKSATVRRIVFETSHGVLFAGGRTTSAQQAQLTVDADDTGVAVAELQAGNEPATARVTATITVPSTNPSRTITRTIDVRFTPVDPADIISLRVTPESFAADGQSRVSLVATVSPDLPANLRSVTFVTTDGQFASNKDAGRDGKQATVVADFSNMASVELISPLQPARAALSATVSNVTARSEVTFTRAGPDSIFLESTQSSILRLGNGTTVLTVFLRRDSGQVTNNTVVTFDAVDSTGAPIGAFSGVTLATIDTTDQSEFKRLKATATFNPDDTASIGPTVIAARVGSKFGTITVQLN
jgi:hypothetical protein